MAVYKVNRYQIDAAIKKLSQEKYYQLRERFPTTKLPELVKDYTYDLEISLVDDLTIDFFESIGIELELTRVKGLVYSQGAPWSVNREPTTIYQVSVSNVGLLSINEIIYEEDACTDSIQSSLNEGWRILAVCPPNDSRRPTYILGRYNQNKNQAIR